MDELKLCATSNNRNLNSGASLTSHATGATSLPIWLGMSRQFSWSRGSEVQALLTVVVFRNDRSVL